MLDSAALVQPALLSGPGYTVGPQTQLHGYMARFDIATAYGTIRADSVEMLAVREAELPALEALDRATKSEAFAHAIAKRGEKTGNALWHVVAHPIDTVAGLPSGVARYFVKKWNTWTNRAQRVSDRAARQLGNEGDPYRVPDGPMSDARAPLPYDPTPPKQNKAWYARAGKEVGREVKRQLEFAKMRREMARELGIDPYTSNELINARLDDLAWAAVVGNVTAKAAISSVGGVAADVISNAGKLDEVVWQLDAEDLKEANRQRLAEFCSDDYAVRQFLHRGGFSDSLRTALTQSLLALKPKKGCNDLIELATTTNSELEARYLVNALHLIERHAAAQGELRVVGAALAYRAPDGELLLPLPVDRLSWTTEIAAFFDQPVFRVTGKRALVGGDMSIPAQRALAERGWSVDVNAPYAGAPAYARMMLTPDQLPAETALCSAEAAGLRDSDPYLDPSPRMDARCRALD